MPKVSQAHRDARRNQILDAATACFAEHGIGDTTMARICKAAGLSAGAVYGHFKGKDEILHAVYDRSIQSNRAFGEQIAASEDPLMTVRQMVAGMVQFIAAPQLRPAHQLSIQVHAAGLSDKDLAQRYAAIHRDVIAQITPLMKALQDEGHIRAELDVEYTMWVIIAAYQGLRVQALLDDDLDLVRFSGAFSMMVDAALGVGLEKK